MVNNVEDANTREMQMLQQYLSEFGQQFEVLSRQLEMLEGRRIESLAAIETLSALQQEGGAPVLLPVGGGASLRVKVLDADKILLNIGSDITIERNNAESREFIEDRIKEMEALGKKLTASMEHIKTQANEVTRRIEAAYQKAQYQAGQ
jgi:prefoldin alpha subunit